MKTRLPAYLTLIAILTLALASYRPGISAPATWTPGDKIVATYYFYWYNVQTGDHMIAPDGSDFITNHPPDQFLADFSYSEVSWHRREMLDMITAGIDVVLPVYFGSQANFYWSKPGLQNLVLAQQALIGEGHTPPKIGMFFDTNALQEQNNGVPVDLTTPAGKDLFYTMIADFFELVPAELRAMIDGRPIVFLYTSTFASDYDQTTFDYINQHFQTDFGTTPWFVLEQSWQGVSRDAAYTWGSALFGPTTTGSVGTLGPGFDDTNNYYITNPPRIRDRECGEFYNAGWEAMIAAGPKLVVVETWNELHEATEIAASREYGRTYINLTAENVARWKATDTTASPVAWMDFGRNTYAHGLQPAFNQPDGAWLVTTLAGREAAYPDATTTPISHFIYLDVNDAFIHDTPSELWVTVEYFDGGVGSWFLQYDGVSEAYSQTELVTLHNSGEWKRHTFHLTDAIFGGREAGSADMRLADHLWTDGEVDYFGRIWISKTAPANQAPDLAGQPNVALHTGDELVIPITASDPDGNALTLSLDRSLDFITLSDNGDGTGSLRIAPEWDDFRLCPYRLRLLATDNATPALIDTVSFQVVLTSSKSYLPCLMR